MEQNKETIRDRILERLEVLDLSMRKASLDAGLGETAIRDLIRNPDQTPSMRTVIKLSAALETSVDWLIHGAERTKVDVDKVDEEMIVEIWARLSTMARMSLRKTMLAHLIMDSAFGEFWDLNVGFDAIRSLPQNEAEAKSARDMALEDFDKFFEDKFGVTSKEVAEWARTKRKKSKDTGNAVNVDIEGSNKPEEKS
ncbi:MAG: helix-turn-helix transcriptional regulator [Pseudomonadota bacterium]